MGPYRQRMPRRIASATPAALATPYKPNERTAPPAATRTARRVNHERIPAAARPAAINQGSVPSPYASIASAPSIGELDAAAASTRAPYTSPHGSQPQRRPAA